MHPSLPQPVERSARSPARRASACLYTARDPKDKRSPPYRSGRPRRRGVVARLGSGLVDVGETPQFRVERGREWRRAMPGEDRSHAVARLLD